MLLISAVGSSSSARARGRLPAHARGLAALAIASVTALASCAHEPAKAARATEPTSAKVPPAAPAARTASTASSTGGSTESHGRTPLVFVEDDYARALADARAKKKPLFVDAWASWCHSCVSLKNFVFTDPALEAKRDDFVWASIDTEKESNAAFNAKFPITVLPTLWVIDPEKETPLVKWTGSLTAAELVALLEESKSPADGARTAAFFRGNQLAAAGDTRGAIAAYRDALSGAPDGWPRRAAVIDALVMRLSDAKEHAACADLAATEGKRLPPGGSRTDTAVIGASCALSLPKTSADRGRLLGALRADLEHLTSDRSLPLLADDRSGAFEALVDVHKDAKDAAAVKRVAADWATFLEGEAARATTKEARATFDPHRLLAYIALDQPVRALAMLDETERDFPSDYNPPARLARAFFEMKRYDDAVAAADRALAKAYGPRKLRIFVTKADVLAAKKDVAGEKRALRDGIDYAGTLTLREGYQKLRSDMQARLDRLGK